MGKPRFNNTKPIIKQGQQIGDKHESRTARGNELVRSEREINREDYNLGWFHPTPNQRKIIDSMNNNECTLVHASSGCGKSTTVIHQALKLLKSGDYHKIVFIKTASEDSDDKIGYLTGGLNSKLEAHMEAMRSIFHTFMTPQKLEIEEKKGRIEFTIPNYCAGKTWDSGHIIIVDECQKISDNVLKLITERISDGCVTAILGDSFQRYAHDKRNDGFSTLIDMVTAVDEDGIRYSKEEPLFGYIEMSSEDNMRGNLSRRVVELFEDHILRKESDKRSRK